MKTNNEPTRNRNRPLALLTGLIVLLLAGGFSPAQGREQDSANIYIGSLACKECHPEEYDNFMTYAKKSTSFQSIEKQMKHLTPEEIKQCYPRQ